MSITAVLYPLDFLFYKVYSKHLGYLIALASQPCPIWTVSRDFLLGVPLVSFVQAICSRFTTWIPWRSLLLLPGSCRCPLIWWFFRDDFCPIFPCSREITKVIERTALWVQVISQEVLYLPSVVTVSWQISYHGILFFALWGAYFDGRPSLDSLKKYRLL